MIPREVWCVKHPMVCLLLRPAYLLSPIRLYSLQGRHNLVMPLVVHRQRNEVKMVAFRLHEYDECLAGSLEELVDCLTHPKSRQGGLGGADGCTVCLQWHGHAPDTLGFPWGMTGGIFHPFLPDCPLFYSRENWQHWGPTRRWLRSGWAAMMHGLCHNRDTSNGQTDLTASASCTESLATMSWFKLTPSAAASAARAA